MDLRGISSLHSYRLEKYRDLAHVKPDVHRLNASPRLYFSRKCTSSFFSKTAATSRFQLDSRGVAVCKLTVMTQSY